MTDFYDRKGEPIGLREWASLLEDYDYRVVEQTELETGELVSTVWVGVDHRSDFTRGRPLIFESMVLRGRPYCVRWSSERQAERGHAALVRELSRRVS